jgi:TonB family protein
MYAPARLSGSLAVVLALSASLSSQTPQQQNADSWPPPGVHSMQEAGVTPPRLLREVKPQYTPNAMRARIEGSVLLEAVVGVDGRVGAVHIVRSLDELNGLDEQAVRALEQWTFTPGMKEGVAVPVLITAQLSYALAAPMTLPKAFSHLAGGRSSQGTSEGVWQEATVDDSGMRIKVSYPAGWNATPSASGRLLRFERLRDRATDEFLILQPKPVPPGVSFNAPFGGAKLRRFAEVVTESLAKRGGALRGAGQTRLGNRLWVWAEVHTPPPDAGRDDTDLWVFSTSEGDRVLQIGCSVLMPKGSSADETAAAIQAAAPAFVEMLRRLTIERLTQ